MTATAHGDGQIVVTGARENNLKDITVRVPEGKISVVTGVSGSGKSSIVFDTIAVESQRQLNEMFPSFIRNRLPRHERPKFDRMENLTPAVVVDQKPVGGGSRSTVGTMTEANAVLRVLFSRYGKPSAGPSNAYSFNDPQGMCPSCEGLGQTTQVVLDRLVDFGKSLNEGAMRHPAFAVGKSYWQMYAEIGLFDPDKPVGKYAKKDRELFLYGGGFKATRTTRSGNVLVSDYEGLVHRFTRRFIAPGLDALKARQREVTEEMVADQACPDCHGTRLNAAARATKIGKYSLADYCAMEVSDLIAELERVAKGPAAVVAEAALAILRRIEAIGLGYLTLSRSTPTLSGGEGQRLKTVRQLGSSLTGLTYIFDEPSVGLHPLDVARLNELLAALRDKGNTVLIVEHDRNVITLADHIIDVGPGAGMHGGEIVFEGTVKQLKASGTLTGRHLKQSPDVKGDYRTPTGKLTVRNARLHNLKNITVDFPTGALTAVTGVAGSGKSTLISGVFAAEHPEAIVIDQSAIGISPRSTPATYTNVWDRIRTQFAQHFGVDAGLFSFNSTGGCPDCKGRGTLTMDLAFMDPVTTVCETCAGTRYRKEVLDHRIAGKNVVDILTMTVEEAPDYFTDPAILNRLQTLEEVGLGYLTLGRPLTMLSGGERQRIKLAHRLHEKSRVYVFDEPSTGLHMADLDHLLALLDRLVDTGNTVIVVEHDLDVIKHTDWIIDIGPDAGKHGGEVVFTGTPTQMARSSRSHTAQHLRASLPKNSTALRA
ncbi:excinuclease ABC subunit UvrA [Streptomyces sp. NPDC050636]|uniref:excinuclease ABC subunit UvrA n=1 Tax=Streptomyces sp. NPDC050636 TaxID=3154510 RepID=UPI003427F77B